MNPPRSASTESIIDSDTNENPGSSWSLLHELSPFGLFLSQFLYMASWLFPQGRLPDWLQSRADQWAGSGEDQQDSLQVNGRNNDLS